MQLEDPRVPTGGPDDPSPALLLCTSSGKSSLNGGDGGDEVITYKRRKYLKQICPPPVDLPVVHESKKYNHLTMGNDVYDGYVRQRLRLQSLLEGMNDTQLSHWKCIMERLLLSLGSHEGGIQSCIIDALAHVKDYGGKWKIGHLQNSGVQKLHCNHKNIPRIVEQCQNSFIDVVSSENFVSLCTLLCENFQGIKAECVLDFSVINSRMKNGEYEHSFAAFAFDFQQVWSKFKKIGEEMASLADCLLKVSQTCYQKQDSSQVVSPQNAPLISNSIRQLSSDLSNGASKLEHVEACSLGRTSTCRKCDLQADATNSLICDGCEAVHHISCIQPILAEIPIRNWYCGACLANGKISSESDWTENHLKLGLHPDCSVCRRLKDPTLQTCESETNLGMTTISSDTEESLDCSLEVNWKNIPGQGGSIHVCKRCKTGGDKSTQFFICHHKHCPYKYYHKRCLRSKELKRSGDVWYCPSCLCRGCLIDRDDDKIILCDGCDEAYHLYCLVPPRKSIPEGEWYCMFCTIEVKMRQKGSTKGIATGSMDILLSAAEKLHSEEG